MSPEEDVGRALVEVLPRFLPDQRWFGEKGRPIAGVSIVDLAESGAGEDRFWLTVVDVRFQDGDDARYFFPIAVRPTLPDGARAVAYLGADAGVVVDAFSMPQFLAWAIEPLARSASIAARRGRFEWTTFPDHDGRLPRARAAPAHLSEAEQSNSSVRYGDAVFLKVFRRLRVGVNPDEEVGRFLATRTTFGRFPMPLGTGRYVATDGSRFSLALAQSYVGSVGDGWSYALNCMAAGEDGPGFSGAARRLGERTGQLHAALASVGDDADFAPEPLTDEDAAAWEGRAKAAIGATQRALGGGSRSRPGASDYAGAFSAVAGDLARRAEGFRALVGGWKTRVHGDYHLGQTLRTPDKDWVLLDFEGEPARPIAERRAKLSPLKDVAGMLRSFAYARGAAWQALPEGDRTGEVGARLAGWEAAARASFLDGYREAIGHGDLSLVPPDEHAFATGLAAWELDKALYEIAYELANRPDWIGLPMGALLSPGGNGGVGAGPTKD